MIKLICSIFCLNLIKLLDLPLVIFSLFWLQLDKTAGLTPCDLFYIKTYFLWKCWTYPLYLLLFFRPISYKNAGLTPLSFFQFFLPIFDENAGLLPLVVFSFLSLFLMPYHIFLENVHKALWTYHIFTENVHKAKALYFYRKCELIIFFLKML